MRKKTIAAFAAVYIAICLTYGTVSGLALSKGSDSGTVIAAEDSSQVHTADPAASPVTSEAPAKTQQQTQTGRSRKRKRSKTTSDETQTDTETSIQTTVPEQTPDESETEKKQDETQIEEQTQAADIPSLEEYLGKLRCGGCGHNCSLANPRCMRGARKQSTAKSEYSEMYG